ncbi:MAG: outer membrane beta-barrel protein [Firmicutes bacterium]|nr:outer membrane beta-barrel protein [Bacillota bacterium]
MKQKRIIKAKVFVVVLLALCVFVLPASGSFWVKGNGFHYSPGYGDLKNGLDKAAPDYDVWKDLSPGTGLALSVGYDFTKNWGLRLDTFKFRGIADYHRLTNPSTYYFETSTSPTLLSIVYRVLPENKLGYYLGAGIGMFASELTIESNAYEGVHYTDSPLGWQALVGTEYRFKQFVLSSEIRYLSAKAEYPGYRCIESCSTDWSGLFISFGVGVNV